MVYASWPTACDARRMLHDAMPYEQRMVPAPLHGLHFACCMVDGLRRCIAWGGWSADRTVQPSRRAAHEPAGSVQQAEHSRRYRTHCGKLAACCRQCIARIDARADAQHASGRDHSRSRTLSAGTETGPGGIRLVEPSSVGALGHCSGRYGAMRAPVAGSVRRVPAGAVRPEQAGGGTVTRTVLEHGGGCMRQRASPW
jgi:hypothetical protein